MTASRPTVVPIDLDPITCPLDGVHQIEASAGTGKTWNLSLLYLRLLLERGLPVGQVLVVTFTNAATAELRERLRGRLADTRRWLLDPHDDPVIGRLVAGIDQAGGIGRQTLLERIDNALAMFDEAAIFTIHGFCQRALSQVPFAAGLPFEFEPIADDRAVCLQVAGDFWRREIAHRAAWPPLAELMLARGDEPAGWAALLARECGRPTAQRVWPDDIDAANERDLAVLPDLFEVARRLWDPALAARLLQPGVLHAATYKAATIEQAIAGWQNAFGARQGGAMTDPAPMRMDLLGQGMLTRRTNKGKVTPAHPFFEAAQAWLDERDAITQSAVLLRLRLLREFLRDGAGQLRAIKLQARLVTYDDMLGNLHGALADPALGWLAPALRQQYPAALVDEFQDTDPLQFDIFRRLYIDQAPAGPLFLIGDPKQAIYSFRGADLHVYLGAARLADNRFTLRSNQRSSPALIDAVNALFTTNPRAFVLEGLDAQPVTAGARSRPPFVDRSDAAAGQAALTLWRLPAAQDGGPIERPVARQMAAAAVAGEILRLLSAGGRGEIQIAGRQLAPQDIAVLVRSHAEGALMRRALAARGIDSVEMSQLSVWAMPMAEELEIVLSALLEPTRARQLKAALATPLMGHSAADIAALDENESALQAVMGRFLDYRRAWAMAGFAPMIRQWMVSEGVDARLLAQDDGERRLTDLLHLCELLQQAAQTRSSADALLRWLATQRQQTGASDETQSRLESDRHLVRIVTIHRSKGLEYGIVFCPFLWDGLLRADNEAEAVCYYDDAGTKVVDYRPPARDDKAIKSRRAREQAAEWVRLAYVAMTRAVYRCYLVCGSYCVRAGRAVGGAAGQPGAASTRQADHALLNWLVAGAGMTWADWAEHKLDNALICQAWDEWVAAHPTVMTLARWPAFAANDTWHAVGDLAAAPMPVARTAPPMPSVSWRVASFSSLQATALDDLAGADHDARVLAEPGAVLPDSLDADDFLRFPRGPSAGDCLHAVFEAIDFTRPDGWGPAIGQALDLHPQRLDGVPPADNRARLGAMLQRVVRDVLSTELPGGFALSSVPPARTLVEMGFHLPATALDAAALDALLRQANLPASRLSFGRLDGYLKGFIDLVFEHEGRYYIADWKSNFLGASAQDYGQRSLQQAMDDHGYTLQYLLYTVALHRYLGRRLADYDHARHFGGVYYLFVRGMRPGWADTGGVADADNAGGAGQAVGASQAQGASARQPPCGVYFRRPDAALVAALDRWVSGSGATTTATGAAA